ncbi:enoyl-CoA hydratase/isomerase family protein [Agrobacterium tumefaciens]|uniref:enoyl-CoA hydratase/isomerase family protein n=1 Tax=Agrobacterium tumefaciens TaxID=358 RepID=UPI001BA80DB5|nr:enoyl-CoA hydratase/isomerase family protein [Agrobacterium tumefaciens]
MRFVFTSMLLIATSIIAAAPASAEQTQNTAAVLRPTKELFSIKEISAEVREVTYTNTPFNFIEPTTLVQLNQAIKELSADSKIKVVIFNSGVSGYFYNHFDMDQFPAFAGQTGENAKPLWVELISNIESAPFVTVASIRGRTQGGGGDLALAFDLRYASREKAIFNQPEVGLGLFPGGGGPDHLARLAGRDRAIEVFLSADDYDAETAEKYGWVTRTVSDVELDKVVTNLAMRLATFDKQALIAVKQHINSITLPTEAERLASYKKFSGSLTSPGLQQRMGVFQKIVTDSGLEKVETNMGYYIGAGNAAVQKDKQ